MTGTDNGPPLSRIRELSSRNIANLTLINSYVSSNTRPRCTAVATLPDNFTPSAPRDSPPIKDSSFLCSVCKKKFKGKRGLNIHLGRSPNCRRNLPDSSKPSDSHVSSIPQKVSCTIKSPSTSVESLNAICRNSINSKFTKHKSSVCKLCPSFILNDKFVSTSTHRIHNSIVPDTTKSVTCNSKNVIYLITCKKCGLQYVGETIQPLSGRICHHVSRIYNSHVSHSSHILANHFNSGHCKGASFSVNIIEKLSGDGRGEDGKLDPIMNRIRKKKETEWMLKLRTVFPYGLNDRVGDEYMENRDHDVIFSKFPSLVKIKERFKVRTRSKTSSSFMADNFIYIINESIRTNFRNTMNLIRVLLSSLKRSLCRKLYDSITTFLSNKHENYRFSQFFLAALDIVKFKIGTPDIVNKPSKKLPSNICRITFVNKAIDFINPHRILKNNDVVEDLPPHLREESPMIVYNLTKTTRSLIFNYKNFVQTLDVDAFLQDNSILPCDCANSPFKSDHHGHIITGDLDIVQHDKLKLLLCKGPKYREPKRFSFPEAKSSILQGIDECISAWSNKHKIPITYFKKWREHISLKIDDRISSFNNYNNSLSIKSSFCDADIKASLTELQNKFVMVPIDKASNNVAFICKRFYASVILQELGVSANEPSPTYEIINDLSRDQIIAKHKLELNNLFNLSIKDDMLTLPDIYWLPKLHKNPIKFRFIIASKRCTTKRLSKDISSIFTLMQKQIESYHNKSHFYSGVKTNWIAHNRDYVLKSVKKSAIRRSAKRVSSFDFSTLYTNIPHDKLINVLSEVINFSFKGGTRSYIYVDRFGIAHWSTKKHHSYHSYTKESITLAVSYLINNSYFSIGSRLFRQIIGIPMGSDPAPAFANLFLFFYESKWLDKMKKSNNVLARKFGQVFRYIDDLLALNDGGFFELYHKDIYPPELTLNKENPDDQNTNFLDLHITIEDGVFKTKLYDKRNNFGFHITRLPYKTSNIPNKMFYTTIAAECLRICRSTSDLEPAINSIKTLFLRMKLQGAETDKFNNSINRIFNKHNIYDKYNTNKRTILAMLHS